MEWFVEKVTVEIARTDDSDTLIYANGDETFAISLPTKFIISVDDKNNRIINVRHSSPCANDDPSTVYYADYLNFYLRPLLQQQQQHARANDEDKRIIAGLQWHCQNARDISPELMLFDSHT